MCMDKDLQEQWKIKQVNVLDVGTGVILFIYFLTLIVLYIQQIKSGSVKKYTKVRPLKKLF